MLTGLQVRRATFSSQITPAFQLPPADWAMLPPTSPSHLPSPFSSPYQMLRRTNGFHIAQRNRRFPPCTASRESGTARSQGLVCDAFDDIVATLSDVVVDLVIFDVDQQRMDDLAAFANRWRGVKVLFQLSTGEPLYDFRSWMADNFVFKHRAIDNVASTVNQLLNN